ncbi:MULTISPECIES: class I SAM-dependent methyltransferase [Bacillus cereus group]|uniref:class I SAM-dependent methyltransferase n=1 Tax=Bacillus cereus group TaxID=86661 RepID=UPI001F5AF276|nr:MULTISPECIES: class I SAM-dependent methyltransferase [Bacillus cereus group]MED0963766.1 class I SAM-dependent methyltransferase [Bacillus paramycoides]MED0970423.1 class I SAM-dependent methyltransferase [Bacillus paramycoides]MED0981079.1 class I SAM-dependent methyltransferase [Bacillus paramycoides]MED0984622.1 class I SAM-dependent methyltransferase [Bacillus paramycoides]MED1091095.1 class I SAM-dependent methyltransferase [Bacillus paramycoides]
MNNFWDDRFKSDEYFYGEEPNTFIQEQAFRLANHNKVIAFAEGEGRNAVFLTRQGHEVIAIDYSEGGLEKTKKLAVKHNVKVHTKKVDLLADSLPANEFDAAIMVFGHFHTDNQRMILNKMIHTIKPGGLIMIEVYSKQQLNYGTGGPKDIDMLYDPIDILTWCEGHEVIHFFNGEQERIEGKGHTGLAHVIQVVIRKSM